MNIHYTNPQFKNLPNELQNHICSYLPKHPNINSYKELLIELIDNKHMQLFYLDIKMSELSSSLLPQEIKNQRIEFRKIELHHSLKRISNNDNLKNGIINEPWANTSLIPSRLRYDIIRHTKQNNNEQKLNTLKTKYKILQNEFDDLINTYILKYGDFI